MPGFNRRGPRGEGPRTGLARGRCRVPDREEAGRGHVAVTLGATNLLDRAYAPHLSYQRDPLRTGVRVHDPGRSLYVNLSLRF